MKVTVICKDTTKEKEFIEHIVSSCIGNQDLPIQVILSSEPLSKIFEAPIKESESLNLMKESRAIEEKMIIEIHDLKIDIPGRRVWMNEKEILLTKKEFDLLAFMATNPNRVLTKEELLKKVWGNELRKGYSTLAVHIQRIRKRIESDPLNPMYIQTVWGSGYKLSA